MVRRLDVGCCNGEAPTAKVPAPPHALICNIKRPKGGAGGFASQRRDQTCKGGGRMKRQWPFATLTSLSHFTDCMYVTSRIISWHYRPSLITNRGGSTLIFCETAQKGQIWNVRYVLKVFYKITDITLKGQSVFSVSSQKKNKWQVVFWKCAIIASHQESIMEHETNPS